MEVAFAESGTALFETMVHTEKVRPLNSENIAVEGHDKLELLYNWLEALLLKFEVENHVFAKFEVGPIKNQDSLFSFRASILGEPYDQARHGRRVGVKGVTYHQMTIEETEKPVKVRFLLDL